jgi:DNA-directed RNA polymerase specialized sigma subunit
MNVKSYLNQARILDKRIDSKLEQVERLHALAERTTTVLSHEPKGTSGTNRTEYCVLKIWELEREVNEDIDRLIDLKREIQDAIGLLTDDKYKLLLEYRYLCGNTWEKIAEKMDIEVRWVYQLHGRALQEISNRTC